VPRSEQKFRHLKEFKPAQRHSTEKPISQQKDGWWQIIRAEERTENTLRDLIALHGRLCSVHSVHIRESVIIHRGSVDACHNTVWM
jgi:hypothetical protein